MILDSPEVSYTGKNGAFRTVANLLSVCARWHGMSFYGYAEIFIFNHGCVCLSCF